jgi:hypothetical protein
VGAHGSLKFRLVVPIGRLDQHNQAGQVAPQ